MHGSGAAARSATERDPATARPRPAHRRSPAGGRRTSPPGGRRRPSPRRLLLLALAALPLAAPTAASADGAPLDRPGPALSATALLHCSPGIEDARRSPVLLVPGTGATPALNYSWSWEPLLTQRGVPWCDVTAPRNGEDDVQTTGELLVDAIRRVHERSGRRVSIIGHSQGGMVARWALRFFPDTRAMVDDVIALAPPNHGSTRLSTALCAKQGCSPAMFQQTSDSQFIAALNAGAETFAGVSYTNVYSAHDDVVTPDDGPAPSSALRTGAGMITNLPTQLVCPRDQSDHLELGVTSPISYAAAYDALDHPGPADPARIDRAACDLTSQPGIDIAKLQTMIDPLLDALGMTRASAAGAVAAGSAEMRVHEEPPIRCYATAAGCPGQAMIRGDREDDGVLAADRACRSTRRATVPLPRGWRRASVRVTRGAATVRRRRGRLHAELTLDGGRAVIRVSARGTTAGGDVRRWSTRLRICASR